MTFLLALMGCAGQRLNRNRALGVHRILWALPEWLDRQAAESRQYHTDEMSLWQRGLARSDETGWFYRN